MRQVFQRVACSLSPVFQARIGASLVAAVLLSAPGAFAQPAPKDKIPLRILYAGHPGSPRERDFTEFLGKYFAQVTTRELAKFDAAQAKDADVVVMDYDGDGFKAPQPELPEGYARPTVTVGVPGAFLCSHLRLKTGYL